MVNHGQGVKGSIKLLNHRPKTGLGGGGALESIKRLQALGVPRVDGAASSLRAAVGTGESASTALSVHSGTGRRRSSGLLSSRLLSSGLLGSGGLSSGGLGGGSRAGTAGPDGRAGHGELLEAVVDAEVGVLIGVLVGAGELSHGSRDAATATDDLDLDAGDVVLGLVDVRAVDTCNSLVKLLGSDDFVGLTDVLSTEEVLAIGSIGGDDSTKSVLVPAAPGLTGEVGAGVADTLVVDLEPVALAVVGLDVVVGSAGHVDQRRAGVLHGSTDTELDADLGAGVDGQDLSATGVGESALVADDVISIDEGVVADIGRRVGGELDGVELGGASEVADVGERPVSDTVDNGRLEEVVGRDHLGRGGNSEGRDLHFEKSGCLERKWFESAEGEMED
jgi:hypothetical protein